MGSVIGFVGLSHLGTVSSVATASKGFEVVGYDPDGALCERLACGQLHVHEPGLPELLAESKDRMTFTADVSALAHCEVVVFSKDIPTSDENTSDTSALDALIDSVVDAIPATSTLVVLSQVTPGYTSKLVDRLRSRPGFETQPIYYQVETLIFGRAVERAAEPERFIVGCEEPKDPLPPAFAEVLESFGCPIFPMRFASAELAKTAINLFLVASVSTTNTLAEICEGIGADWSDIIPTLRLDKRIGPHAYLVPGLGLSGGNLERDLVTLTNLASAVGADWSVINAYTNNSIYRHNWALRTLHAQLDRTDSPAKIAVWGLAYKPHTHSTKNSPSLALVSSLAGFDVRIYDPQAEFSGGPPAHVRKTTTPLDACDGADALIVMTPWPEFAEIDLKEVASRTDGRLLLDPFACLDAEQCAALGFEYRTLGVTPRQRRAA